MIKEKVKTIKGFVKELRKIRDKINLDIQNMSFEQEKAYLKNIRLGEDSPQTLK